MLAENIQNETITLTPTATQAFKDLLIQRNLQGYALRVFVAGGGCSGYQYGLALEGNIREQDLLSEFDGVQVVVDEISIEYLRGAKIDYIESEAGKGFKIDSPNPLPSCGCDSPAQNTGCSGCG